MLELWGLSPLCGNVSNFKNLPLQCCQFSTLHTLGIVPVYFLMLDQPNIRNVRLEPRITNHGARTTNHELLCAFDFAIGENEQAAVDGAVVERDAGDVVEVDHLGKFRASSYQSTHIAFAFLVHESAYALIHASEFHRIAKAYAIFRIEEDHRS